MHLAEMDIDIYTGGNIRNVPRKSDQLQNLPFRGYLARYICPVYSASSALQVGASSDMLQLCLTLSFAALAAACY